MKKGPEQNKAKTPESPTLEGARGPAHVERARAIEAILSDPAMHISRGDELPASIECKNLLSGTSVDESERVTGLSAMCLTALTADIYRASMQSCAQVDAVSRVLGPVSFALASEAGAYDVEFIGIGNIIQRYPEIAAWRLGEVLKNPEVNQSLTLLAMNGLIGIDLELAKYYARSYNGNYFGNPNIESRCEDALERKEPLPQESFTPTLTDKEQEDVKRLYTLGRKAVFDTDQATALEAIDKLAKEPIEFGVPLLVAVTRYENEACQQAARAHIRHLAPYIADLLPEKFDEYSYRIAHFV